MLLRIYTLALTSTLLLAMGCGASDQQVRAETPADDQGVGASATEATDMSPAALDNFRQPLDPYGQWVEDPVYGTVWVPNSTTVGPDFVPYETAGHWGLTTDDQWIWVSDYDWGWAPFHYGRWVWIDGRGWSWIAGSVYAPAWVVWQTGYYDEAYVGWAPMAPTWYWRGGVATRFVVNPAARFVYVPSHQVFRPGLREHVVPEARVSVVASHSQPYLVASAGGQYHALALAHGPNPSEARIPAVAMPTQRVGHDPQAIRFQRQNAAAVRRTPAVNSPRRSRRRH